MPPDTTADAAQPTDAGGDDGSTGEDAALVMGVDLGGTKCHGALADSSGAIVVDRVLATAAGAAYETLLQCVEALRADADARGHAVAALGIGVPAVIDPEAGMVFDGPNVGWQGFDLGMRLTADVTLPLTIDNDADLAAVGEARRGAGKGVPDFVVVSVGTGIGAAVVVDGRLVKGRHNAAGEIGSMVLGREHLREATRGGLGAFERVAAGPGLVLRAIQLLAERDEHGLSSDLDPAALTAHEVFVAERRGDPVAVSAVDGLLDDLAMGLIALVSTLDPAAIILEGGVGRALRPHLDDLVRRIVRHAPSTPLVTISTLQPTATLVGALVSAQEIATSGLAGGAHFGTLARSLVLVPAELSGQPR